MLLFFLRVKGINYTDDFCDKFSQIMPLFILEEFIRVIISQTSVNYRLINLKSDISGQYTADSKPH